MHAEAVVRKSQLVAAVVASSLPVYGLITWTVQRPAEATAGPNPYADTMRLVLGAVAATLVVLTLAWPNLIRRLAAATPAPQRFLLGVVQQFALAEAIAVFGLVLSFASRDSTDYLLFALPSAALMVWLFPTRGRYGSFVGSG
ncbi:MAG: hypothetical protein HY718_14665 [Planctomycetes bacterium]|nr:hypothetical protein [Planctomycetota bacterium]